MTANLVYARDHRRTLPYDLQRYITTKYLDEADRRKYAIEIMCSDPTTSTRFADDLKSLPPSVRTKVFVHGIYNKLQCILQGSPTHRKVVLPIGHRQRTGFIVGATTFHIRSHPVVFDYIENWLNTLYFGFRTSGADTGKSCPLKRHLTHFDTTTNSTVSGEGLLRPTTKIRVDDLRLFITMFVNIGGSTPRWYQKPRYLKVKALGQHWYDVRDNILYQFSLLVSYLANKYRRIARENDINAAILKQRLIVSREESKKAKVAEKEQAKLAKAAEKEQAKILQKIEKECVKRELKQMKLEERMSKQLAKQ